MARALRLSPDTLYQRAHRARIRLRRGRRLIRPSKGGSVKAYREHFDQLMGRRGAWRTYLRDGEDLSCAELARKWGFRWRQQAAQYYRELSGGKGKPVVRRIILRRPDVTLEKIRALARRGLHRAAVARALRTGEDTVRQRVRGQGVSFAQYRCPLVRPDVTVAAVRHEAERQPSVLAMARALKVSHITVAHRARQGSFELPNGRFGPKPETIRTLEATARYRRRGFTFRKIARILRRKLSTLRRMVTEYRSYFEQLLTPKRRSKAA